MRLHKFKSN